MPDEGDDAEAGLRPVGGVQEIQVIGALSDAVANLIVLSSDARTVWLHPSTITHLIERRPPSDVEFVLENISAAILRPQLVGVELRNQRKLRIVHRVDGADRWLHVAVKLVLAAEAGCIQDELWVSTAYPMGRSLTRLRNKATLWRVTDL